MPPNSEAVVWPTSTAPASRSRAVIVPSYAGDPILEDEGGFGLRPARHRIELFHANGDATEGQCHVRRFRRLPSLLLVDETDRVQRRILDGRQRSLERFGRGAFPVPESFDERAGIAQPRWSRHRLEASSLRTGNLVSDRRQECTPGEAGVSAHMASIRRRAGHSGVGTSPGGLRRSTRWSDRGWSAEPSFRTHGRARVASVSNVYSRSVTSCISHNDSTTASVRQSLVSSCGWLSDA